jgi:hypothetical protein
MPFTVTSERRAAHVRFAVAGPASLMNYFELIEHAARETRPAGDTRVLVDLCGVVGRLHVQEQTFIGEMVAEKLAHLHRLAVVVPEAPNSYNSEPVARGKGFNLRSFGTEADALHWLDS